MKTILLIDDEEDFCFAETGPVNFERIGGRYFIGKPVATDELLKGIKKVFSLEG